MRICFIADAASIHVKRIVSYYVNQKDDVLVLSTATTQVDISGARTVHLIARGKSLIPGSGGNSPTGLVVYLKRIIPRSVKAYVRRSIRDLRVLGCYGMCVEEIARFNPDVFFCNRSFPEGVLAGRCHVRPLLLRTAGQDMSKLTKYPVYRQLIRKAVRSASVVLLQSVWEKEWLRKLCGDGLRVEVNLIGIDHKKFRPSYSQAKLRTIYGIPQNAFVVVTNRYLTRPYNGWLVVKALESIVEKWPNLILFYTTPWKMDTSAKARAEAITARCPQIRFLEGPVAHAEMPTILGCGDVYVSFSSYDGIPNSVLEAMACGLVPVAADLPQLREWIEDGVDGYVVPQSDTEALAATVSYLYQHREVLPDMGARCVEKIRTRASYDVCSEKTRKLLAFIARKSNEESSVAV